MRYGIGGLRRCSGRVEEPRIEPGAQIALITVATRHLSRGGCNPAEDWIAKPEAVIGHKPDIIIDFWCGKKFRQEKVGARPGLDAIPAARERIEPQAG
jgi:hypothetical protein